MIAAYAAALVVGIVIGATGQGWRLGSTIAAMKQKQAELVAANHKTESMWSAHVIRLGDEANAENDRLRAAAARANDAARSLHDASSRHASAAASPAASREAAAAAVLLFAELHRELDEFAGEAAKAAGESRGAGAFCERTYEVTR